MSAFRPETVKQFIRQLFAMLKHLTCHIQQRYVLTIMAFLAIFNAFAMRANLSIAITKMVRENVSHSIYSADNTSDLPSSWPNSMCPLKIFDDNESNLATRTKSVTEIDASLGSSNLFEWSQEQQGIILSSFHWGYLLSHLPGSLIAQKFGGKYVVAFSIFLSGILSMLIPLCVQSGGLHSLIAIRVLMGISQGPILPACLNLFSSWIPTKERCTMLSFAYSGIPAGTIFGMFLTAQLLHYMQTWQVVFYIFGIMSILWFFLFILLCYRSPIDHPFINRIEKHYLERELGSECDHMEARTMIPWKAMLSSGPVIVLTFTHIAHDWGFYMITTDLPKYMNDVLHVSIPMNGLYSSLPHLVELILSFFVGFLSDWITTHNWLSITNTRKLFVAIASFAGGAFLMAASYAECNETLVVLFLTIAVGSQCLTVPSTRINTLDLSPNYVGVLTGVVNGIGSISGVLAPYIVGVMTPNSLLSEWRSVFWITFALYMAAMVFFSIWGSGEIQPWNEVPDEPRDIEAEIKITKSVENCIKIISFLFVNALVLFLVTYI